INPLRLACTDDGDGKQKKLQTPQLAQKQSVLDAFVLVRPVRTIGKHLGVHCRVVAASMDRVPSAKGGHTVRQSGIRHVNLWLRARVTFRGVSSETCCKNLKNTIRKEKKINKVKHQNVPRGVPEEGACRPIAIAVPSRAGAISVWRARLANCPPRYQELICSFVCRG